MGKTTKLTTAGFIDKANSVHNNYYDYSKVEYINNKTKVIITCPIHGEFEQTPKGHLIGNNCPLCAGGVASNTDKFKEMAIERWGNLYKYSKVDYINSTTPVVITCPIHGEFEQTPTRHLSKKTKYGCKKCSISSKITTSLFLEKVKTQKPLLLDQYKFNKVEYINSKTPVELLCKYHGSFYQTPNQILNKNIKDLCPYCSHKIITNDIFIQRSKKIHGSKYDYSNVDYLGSKTKVKIICRDHGEFKQQPNSHLCGNGCPSCGATSSNFEQSLIENLSKFELVLNSRSIIPPMELDIYIPDKKITIECNGNYWHSELNGKNKKYHLNKTKECEKQGLQLIHVFESEYLQKKDIVESLLVSKLGVSDRLYGRKCEVKYIEPQIKNSFLSSTHLQGKDKSSVGLGLYYNDELVSVMTFCKSRFNKNYEWELSRFASKLNTTVVGGASKLLNHFIKNHNPKSIISYANRRYSNGNLYKQLGFTFLHDSSPNYFYIKNDYLDLCSRQQFQKHKLKDKLEIFDPNLTEWENMKLNGYDRIWDCGNSVWGITM